MSLDVLLAPTTARGARWSVRVTDVDSGAVVAEHEPGLLLRTASVGKVFLLVVVAEQIGAGGLDPRQPVDRRTVPPVADSGLWQHLSVDVLPLVDVARLVGTVSDNWATNALLDLVGTEPVQECARRLAPGGSMLHDHVRDERGPEHPQTLSEGCASDWTAILPALDPQVLEWLATSVDLSMVASAFGLDPLAHRDDGRMLLRNKTGTSDGVRADVGLVDTPGHRRAYAAIANWDPHGPDLRDAVLAAMRGIGELVRPG